ncbi:MAG: glutamate-5-semialdehyde dehydrogenase [Nitrospinae bacterium]|nr:glutamate-5-semialdehyde dehydrogenase [Nitrospinota bacterium]
MEKIILEIVQQAKEASRVIATQTTEIKDKVLRSIGENLQKNSALILQENKKDIDEAEKLSLSKALIDRLLIDEKRIDNMVRELSNIINLKDPVGEVEDFIVLPNALKTGKMRVPIGVIGIIYESRPNVTLDTSALCIKSGNAIILKGGSEAFYSNVVLAQIIRDTLKEHGLPEDIVQYINTKDRKAVTHLLKQHEYIDIIIPRGGPNLIKKVVEESSIPVIKHDAGVCHLYLDKDYDKDIAIDIIINSKAQRPGVCNALECLLIHKEVESEFLLEIINALKENEIEVRGCSRIKEVANVKEATDDDWGREFLDKILAVRVVNNYQDAVDFIARYSSQHTDGIITSNYSKAMKFTQEVDSSAVIVNASTRFNDGGQLGFGSEMGISTQKLHVRGPMGLKDLTCCKNIIFGEGQIRC